MPNQVPATTFDLIHDAVSRIPGGGTIDAIQDALAAPMTRRTLQRRLADFVAEGRLARTGRGPGTRYHMPGGEAETTEPVVASESPGAADNDYGIPLSEEGASVSRAVRQPIQTRRPVGYHREFLDDYRPGATWYVPAEVRERCLALGLSPDEERPAGTYVLKIYERLLIDLSWNSSRLEGNTYSLLETERLLELGEAADGTDARETQMILNHKAAIDLLVRDAERIALDRYTTLNLHALLADNLLPDPQAAGRLRSASVGIGRSSYHPPEIPQLIEECFGLILDKASAIPDPFEQAFFVLAQLPYLQPFIDVNKRVSRLAANVPLVRGNLCPLSFVDVPTQAYVDGLLGVYEFNRVALLLDVFCWAYERSSARYSVIRQSLGEPDPFRIRHRALLAESVHAVVAGMMDRPGAVAHLRRRAAEALPAEARSRFVELVETDLLGLHEGRLAPFGLTQEEFAAWQAHWR